MPLYFEDLSVGQRFESAPRVLGADEIMAYAEQFDPQPFHTDPEAAKSTFFGGLAASGWHMASLAMRMLVEGGPELAGGIIGMGGELQWPRPTRPGDTLRLMTEVTDVSPLPNVDDRGVATLRSELLNQKDKPVLVMTMRLVSLRRPATA